MVIVFGVFIVFMSIVRWLEMQNRKRIERAYAIYVKLLEKDRDDWQRLAQGPRRIEGDEWKDG